MPYKVKKLVRKVDLYVDNGQFIPAEDITIDTLTKTDSSTEEVVIAWFDKTINTALFDFCSKVQFAVSNETPDTVSLSAETEDVALVNMYKSSETFTAAQLKTFVRDHAKAVKVVDFVSYPPAGYNSASISKPATITGSDANIKVAIIPISELQNLAATYIYAWTIKSDVVATGASAEITNI